MKRVILSVLFGILVFSLFYMPVSASSQRYTQWQEEISVDESGYFNIRVEYQYLERQSSAATGTILIDGVLPSPEAEHFIFPKRIAYADFPFLVDSMGNDRMPYRTQLMVPDSVVIQDREGRMSSPLVFFFESGLHCITIEVDGFVRILGVELKRHNELPSHYEYINSFADAEKWTVNDTMITVEAENMSYKSGMNIVPSFMAGAAITPQEPGVRRLNVIGLTSFDAAGDFAEWSFDVKESGFYFFTFRYMQNMNVNLNSYRTIYINGQVPFYEFKEVAFPFTTRWRNFTLEQFPVFLESGENTIRLAVTTAPYAEISDALFAAVGGIRNLDMNLRSVIGNEVDPFRIWNLENYLPHLVDSLTRYADELDNIMYRLAELSGFGVDEYRIMQAAVRDLRQFAHRPDDLARSVHSLSQVFGSLTDWLISLERQPIVFDKFFIHSADAEMPQAVPNIFVRFWHALRNFFASFFDAAATGDAADEDGERLQVWVRRSRDYVDLMQRMSDDFFTPETGIPVNVNFIPDTTVLILANAAGTLPELAAGMDINVPFEYALRGALVDLTRFDGFDLLTAPMAPGALVPYRFMGGVYALPEEVIFNVLYYRTDIFEQLGLTAPDTWDDVLDVVHRLYTVNSTFFYPYGDFQTFFAQRGIPIYTDDGLSLAADSEEGFSAFRFWTDLYIKHGLPARMDSFYQHFRMGTAPIGVAGVGEYIRFELTAPDIAGQWNVAPIPGTINEQGLINRSQAGNQNGIMMFNTAPEREENAWTFLQWWLATETQILFAQNLVNFYGPEFRWHTANLDVIRQLDWRQETLDVFAEQLMWYNPVPLVPGGSYMTGREIWNAWTRTVIRQEHYREQLEIAFRDVSMEMERKQLEFGFIDENGEILRTLDIQTHDPMKYFMGRKAYD